MSTSCSIPLFAADDNGHDESSSSSSVQNNNYEYKQMHDEKHVPCTQIMELKLGTQIINII